MRLLEPHPQSTIPNIRIEAEAKRGPAGRLALRYFVSGDLDEVVIPIAARQARRDGLWQHSCFEAFIRLSDGLAYYELNFSPAREWAAYRFSSHRAGMIEADLPAPQIVVEPNAGRLTVEAQMDLGFELATAPAPWRLGLSAVIETRDGARSFWALAHPPGDPDFHHRDCFALELPPPTGG